MMMMIINRKSSGRFQFPRSFSVSVSAPTGGARWGCEGGGVRGGCVRRAGVSGRRSVTTGAQLMRCVHSKVLVDVNFDGGEEARGLPIYAHEVQRCEV